MAEHLKLISPSPARPVRGGFIETKAATEILYKLGRSKEDNSMGLVCGAPGIGKTEAIWRFKNTTPGVHMMRAVQGEGGAYNLATELYRVLDIHPPRGRNLADDRRHLAERFGPDCMLIIDEAQYLVKQNPKGRDDWEAFEWARGLAEEAFMSVVFCGDLRLRELAQVAEPLWRRMRLCIITSTPREDVEALAAKWGIVDQKACDALYTVVRKSGGALASAVAVCREAHIMAGSALIGFEHVAAAVQDLQLLGGK